MSELRRDPTIGRWVIIAPERGHRPLDRPPASERMTPLPPFDPACPFCPGNESMLPSIIAETASIERPGWRARVVANKFPAVGQDATHREHGLFYETTAGRGHHEVIVESPRHDEDLTTMSKEGIREVVVTHRSRYDALMAEKAVQSVIVFRNRGTVAGASLRHPHSQMIALETVPPLVEARQTAMLDYYEAKGRCLLCDIIAHERADGRRIVNENEAFLTIVPFAPVAPCETWLLPKRHQADFGEIESAAIDLLAIALQDALVRLEVAFGDPPYNYVIDAASKGGSKSRGLHWRLRIVPQLTTAGGFELASGLPINPSLPEQDAVVLRSSFGRFSNEAAARAPGVRSRASKLAGRPDGPAERAQDAAPSGRGRTPLSSG